MITSTVQTEEVQRSHRVIEKKRRDKINTCLAQLTRAVPAAFAKQTSGKLEKAEILEMTVQYLQALEASTCTKARDICTDSSIHYQSGYEECVQAVAAFLPTLCYHPADNARSYRLLSHLRARRPFKPTSDSSAIFSQRPADAPKTLPGVPVSLECTEIPSGTDCSAYVRVEQCAGDQGRCALNAGRYQTMEQRSCLQTTLSQLGRGYGHGYYSNYPHPTVHTNRFLPYQRPQGLSKLFQLTHNVIDISNTTGHFLSPLGKF